MKFTRTQAALLTGLLASATSAIYYFAPTEKSELTAYEQWAQEKIEKKRNGKVKSEAPEIHGIIQKEIRTKHGDDGPKYGPNQVMEEFMKAKNASQKRAKARTSADDLVFEERGPGNVGGRTRALIVDPDDETHQTFFAGAASGGIWKTTDAGTNWAYISDDLPNLGVNTLAMAPSNTNVIYAGTGEHFTSDIDGAGMFKSTDKGTTWEQIADPSVFPDFKNVSRIVVDPNDENVVIATTRSTVWGAFSAAIYKTIDGGSTWTRLRSSTNVRYDDIAFDPTDFNILYVAVNASGVIKSTDGGVNWTDASIGMVPSGRIEICISPVNPNRLWASVEGSLGGSNSDLYVTNDGAQNWFLVVDDAGTNEDFLGGQGWYDNIITAHPFDEDIVYVGGVDTWKFELTGADAGVVRTLNPSENGTEAFMSFVNFGGGYLGGGMDLGEVAAADLLPVEIRFGQGTQMAHRFTVDGQGSGVPAEDYTYEDYVEVPFQVWDTENNVQLMVSFRDQQEDGAWNLIANNTEGAETSHSREYLYIHKTSYSATPSASIATVGGHEVNQMYFFWPVLASGASFDASNLPQSNLAVEFLSTNGKVMELTSVSDAYAQYGGANNFPQASRTSGLHPDQHNIVIYDLDESAKTFRMLVGNDGGVYRTVASTDPGPTEGDYEFISYGYNTTQFYSADKAPGSNRYAGGMQDNGTWYHAAGVEGGPDAQSTFGIGGDGFETIWHAINEDKIIGGSQYNGFAKTINGGSSWSNATSGLQSDGPFVSRLANHKSNPDVLYTVAASGIYKSEDFGTSWAITSMTNSSLWSFNNNADVEISYANPEVVWAGGSHYSGERLYVSTDGGDLFAPTENYDEFDMGSVSGFGTHPSDDSVAYILFSYAGFPKVIKTTDLGQSWEDISGFDGSGNGSTRGFPDVAVNCIYVFPTDENKVWVGSEIGIIESLDGGATWGLLDSNMPPVNIYDFKQVEDQIVIATYGRGIWSVTVDGLLPPPAFTNSYTNVNGEWVFQMDLGSTFDSVEVYLDDVLLAAAYELSAGSTIVSLPSAGTSGMKQIKLIGYRSGNEYVSEQGEGFLLKLGEAKDKHFTDFSDPSDFTTIGLTVGTDETLNEASLHSAHPYESGIEAVAYFNYPVTVSRFSGLVTYDDIALMQPESDFVVFEVSTNGRTWSELEDAYDASLYEDWQSAFTSGSVDASLFKTHTVDLKKTIADGQPILMRFRLNSEAGGTGFGWIVDNLSIQENIILSEESVKSNIEIYPNPISTSATLIFDKDVPSTIEVYNLEGKKVSDIVTNNEKRITWNRGSLQKGVYILKYSIGDQIQSQKIILK
ncbi:VPS10 domain-containing protein [Marinoscillum pacificum]|uniref:VPS10 domain-containing protein n=1 Tax=Marinoscillum pacificum TaxID=392723 RepID=UPI0021587C63|nr:T9SS type A sorting domain-containing protein [Marinoscillum pacificum]